MNGMGATPLEELYLLFRRVHQLLTEKGIAIDKNYGGVIILFDRWFGTYEEEQEQVDYGVATRQPKTNNPLKLNFQEFIEMWKDVLRPGPLGQRLKHLWAPPDYVRVEKRDKGAGV